MACIREKKCLYEKNEIVLKGLISRPFTNINEKELTQFAGSILF